MATDQIDMSLDEIIKKNRIGRGRGRGRGRGTSAGRGFSGGAGAKAAMSSTRGVAARGGFRGNRGGRFSQRGATRGGFLKGVARGGVQKRPQGSPAAAYRQQNYSQSARGQGDSAWQQSKYPAGGAVTDRREGKLLISNLESGVTDSDINELFTEFGALRKAAVHYDRNGRSLGTAEVIFDRRLDGVKALKQYNNVPLDGRPMKIQLVEDGVPPPVPQVVRAPVAAQNFTPRGRGGAPRRGFTNRGAAARGGASFRSPQGFRGTRGGFRGRGGRGAGRGGRGKPVKELTKDQLDAQLDAYNSKMDLS